MKKTEEDPPMTNMEEALYRVGAHIVFKQVRPDVEEPLPLRKWKVPVPYWRKKKMLAKSNQVVIGGIARDPVDSTARIVTSKAHPIHLPPQ
jgi:hypothetical protein